MVRSSAVSADSFCASNWAIRRRCVRAHVAATFERRPLAFGRGGIAVVAVEFGEAPVDVGLVDRADALGRHGDFVQVVERGREDLLGRGRGIERR